MAKKRKLWDINNVLTTLKAGVVSIVTGIPMALLVYGRGIAGEQATVRILSLLMLGYGIFQLWFWGFLAKKWWKFK